MWEDGGGWEIRLRDMREALRVRRHSDRKPSCLGWRVGEPGRLYKMRGDTMAVSIVFFRCRHFLWLFGKA